VRRGRRCSHAASRRRRNRPAGDLEILPGLDPVVRMTPPHGRDSSSQNTARPGRPPTTHRWGRGLGRNAAITTALSCDELNAGMP
jgi:hypothetical protein